ncbi:MAG: hypothetical protein IKE01_07170 [Clostridia bacterium]|nr:hypothetical protein [Clostridia bacterium]
MEDNNNLKIENDTSNEQPNKKSSKRVSIIIISVVVGIVVLIGVFLLGRFTSNFTEFSVKKGIGKYIEPDVSGNDIGDNKQDNKDEKIKKGKIYNKVALNDTQARIKAFEGLIPEGWKASIKSNWNVVSSNVPGVESVTLVSPDGKATIVIDSNQAFVENAQYSEGVNYDYYSTYLHYMTGDEFVQYYMDLTYGNSAQLLKDMEDDTDVLEQADACTNALVEGLKASSSWINYSGYGLNYTVTPVKATMSKRQYKIGEKNMEGSCVIIGVDSLLETSYVPANKNRDWEVLYSIVYMADDKETFDKYYDDYNFIVANSQFTTDYYALVEYVASSIVNTYAQYYAEKSKAGLEAMNNYINSNYSSTTSQSTNEKVMEMWDDYIKDVDCYKTQEGNKIKTSIFNDTVAQNGDSFYVGTKAGIPNGYTELSKSY